MTRELAAVLQELFDAGTPVIAFNASYDFTVLAAESARYGIPQLSRFPVLDPYIMNKQVDRYRKGKRTLTALCEEYGVNLDNAHTSAADALATLRMLDAMAGKFPKLSMPATKLTSSRSIGPGPGRGFPELPAQDQTCRRDRGRLAGAAARRRQPRGFLTSRLSYAVPGRFQRIAMQRTSHDRCCLEPAGRQSRIPLDGRAPAPRRDSSSITERSSISGDCRPVRLALNVTMPRMRQ